MFGFEIINNTENIDEKIMRVSFGTHILKEFRFNSDKMAHSDLVKMKLKFIDEINKEYPDITKKQLLLSFANMDNDMLEYYKSQCPDVCQVVNGGVIMKTSHPERTERLNNKLTPDEKVYLQMCLTTFRKKFLNYI